MNSYNVGQKVVFLFERGGGTVVAVNGNHYAVEDETGFVRNFQTHEIAPVLSEDYKDLISEEVNDKINQDKIDTSEYLTKSKVSGRKKPMEVWEVDLHVDEVLESHYGMSNSEILRRQVEVFKSVFRSARDQRIRKLIVIHGVGEGVLKHELYCFLKEQSDIEFYDAEYKDYGKGATEVRLYNFD